MLPRKEAIMGNSFKNPRKNFKNFVSILFVKYIYFKDI